MQSTKKSQMTYLTFPHSDFKVDIRKFKTFEQNLMKGVNQQEEVIHDPENTTADNVLKHISIVKAFVGLVDEKIKNYKNSVQELYGDISSMKDVVDKQIQGIMKEILPQYEKIMGDLVNKIGDQRLVNINL